MTNKLDGVKVSVNNDSDKTESKTEVPQKVSEKKPRKLKKTIKKNEVKKTVSENKTSNKRGGSMLQNLISVLITAVVVGGLMYFWQNKTVEKVQEKAGTETETLKADLENRLLNLKSKVTGVETTNVELKKTLEEFQKKAELLVGSKKEYKNDDLGLSFEYPASFGAVDIISSESASSSAMKIAFANNTELFFAGVAKSYTKTSSSSSASVEELKGFIEEKKKYYLLGPNDSERFEVNPAEVVEFDGGKALLIDKNSFVLSEGSDGTPVNIGDNVAFIFNLKKSNVAGLSIVNSNFSLMPLNDFVLMMESFKIN